MEVATALAYGGAGQWMMETLGMTQGCSVKQWPRNVQLLVQDHQRQPFSSPSLVIGSAEAVRSPHCTFMSPECSDDYYAAFTLIAIGELARYKYSRDRLMEDHVLEKLLTRVRRVNSDDVSRPLLIRALAFMAMNDTAKMELTETQWMEYIQRWGVDDSDQSTLYTAALYKAILGDLKSGVRLLQSVTPERVKQHLDVVQCDIPSFYHNVAATHNATLKKKE